MNETTDKLKNGGKRGEKMTRDELQLNKEILKEVSKIKKEANIDDLLEQFS